MKYIIVYLIKTLEKQFVFVRMYRCGSLTWISGDARQWCGPTSVSDDWLLGRDADLEHICKFVSLYCFRTIPTCLIYHTRFIYSVMDVMHNVIFCNSWFMMSIYLEIPYLDANDVLNSFCMDVTKCLFHYVSHLGTLTESSSAAALFKKKKQVQ